MARLYVKIKDQDNVAVAVEELKAGTEIMEGLTAVSYTHLTLPTICSV